MVEYENSVKTGTNVLGYDGDVYDPSGEQEAAVRSQVLGGSSRVLTSSSADSMEDRRRRVLEAAEKRLRQEEEEMENSCGTAGPSAVSE